jgi:TonB family protein
VIAVWMLYCIGIGLAFVVVGFALERGLHLAGRPTRGAWVVALLGSYLIPVAVWLRPAAFPVSAAPAFPPSSVTTSTTAAIFNQATFSRFPLGDFDAPLRWAWILVSCAMLVALAVGTARLLSMRRQWRRSVVDGREVLISLDTGPAVVGLWSPRVVLPEWTLALPAPERELMLAHEEQHLRARDPVLLAAALGAVLVAPWNLALWWQWRRLRLAVEMDCDARVLAQGRSAPLYGELLLRVGGRRTERTLGIAAFGEPVSFLESRIRRMFGALPRWRWAGVGAALIVAAAAIVGACETPRPLAPSQALAQQTHETMDRTDASVDERAQLVEAPRLIYPDLLRRAGIEGRVVVQLIVGVNGRAEPASVKVLDSPNPGFNQSAINWALNARFRPARVGQRPVRVLVSLPVEFRSQGDLNARMHAELADRGAFADSLPRSSVDETLERLSSKERDDALRTLAQQSEPAAFAGARNAIALIVDSDNRLIAHASGMLEPGHRSCGDDLVGLLPAFRNTRFPISGCMIADRQRPVVVYWGQLPKR